MRRGARAAAAMLLLAAAGTACYRPRLTDCQSSCTGQCPSPLRCVAGLCTHGDLCPPPDGAMERPPAPPDVDPAMLPSAIPDLVLWLDPEYELSTGPSFRWRDRSGQGNDATATAETSPTLVPAVDGMPPTVVFSAGRYLTLPQNMTDLGHGISIFVVADPSPPDRMSFVDLGRDLGNTAQSVNFGVGGNERFFMGGALVYDDNYSRQLFAVVAPGEIPGHTVAARQYRDGVDIGGSTAIVVGAIIRLSNLIGRSNDPGTPDYQGTLSEILIYRRNLSADERQLVERYLLGRWRLP